MERLHFPQHFKDGFPKPTKKISGFDFQLHPACFEGVCNGEFLPEFRHLHPETTPTYLLPANYAKLLIFQYPSLSIQRKELYLTHRIVKLIRINAFKALRGVVHR